MHRPLLIVLGFVFVILGFIGAFLPVLPTTPFLILAAYLFSKSSPRLHQWILSLKYFGPMVREWEEYGVIKLKAKIWCTLIIVGVLGATIIFANIPRWVVVTQIVIMISVTSFVWTRPSQKRLMDEKNSTHSEHSS